MPEHNRKILVCIPACNESKAIGGIIKKAREYSTEVIVCDDGSVDNTHQIAEAAGAIVIRHDKNEGYGASIKTLFQAARARDADIMVTLDSDGQHDPDQIPRVVEPLLKDEFDIVIGSRYLTASDRQRIPSYRSVGIRIITRLAHKVSYEGITDAQSGFRAYSRNAIEKIELFEKGMPVSMEILINAKQYDLAIAEVPITVTYDIKNASTHNSMSHGIGILYSIIQFIIIKHPLLFYGLPGLVLITVSVMVANYALELFVRDNYVSIPLILLSLGSAVIGIIMLLTATLIYAMKTVMRR